MYILIFILSVEFVYNKVVQNIFWECNFPMNHHVLVSLLVGRLVRRSVFHNFLRKNARKKEAVQNNLSRLASLRNSWHSELLALKSAAGLSRGIESNGKYIGFLNFLTIKNLIRFCQIKIIRLTTLSFKN